MAVACITSEQTPLDLIAIDGPAAVGLFFAAEQLQVGSGADLFDQTAKQKRLAAVNCAAGELPAADGAIDERQVSSGAQQQKWFNVGWPRPG